MIGPILSNALIAVAVIAFFALLRSQAKRPALRDPQTGELVLQCSPVLVWSMGLIAVGGPLAMGLLSLVIPFEHPNQVFVPIGLGLFFFTLGGLMCWWAARRRTRISEDGLTSEFMFASPQFLPWEETTKVNFSSGQEFWIQGEGRRKAMLHVWHVGVAEVVPLLRKHLPVEVRRQFAATIDQFANTVGADTAPVIQRGFDKAPPRRKRREAEDEE